MRSTQSALAFYGKTLGRFLPWLEAQSITAPAEVEARHVRALLASLEGKSDSTVNAFARAIRTLLIFWHADVYMPGPVSLTSKVFAACRPISRAKCQYWSGRA
jgi:site-specific recombinase XerD